MCSQIEFANESTGVPQLTVPQVKNYQIPLPPTLAEQERIAGVLSDMDALLAALDKLIAKKKQIKTGAMQKLLAPQKDWETNKLGEILDYEQPQKYIVRDTEYLDKDTPVLTAGKSFILGYTDEQDNHFTDLPVIIFDDFTTATKFVDFPFKVKSSAMKMLKLKNLKDNIRLIYELIQMIDYEPTDHQRHWISKYSKFEITLPKSKAEQERIASILSDMDAEIAALERKREKYRQIKAGAMQQLLTGKVRLLSTNQ
jgi:type I restriction enzyme S subunit